MLKRKILNKESGIIFYGLTPPKAKYSNEKIDSISKRQIKRISNLKIDGLILYDLQDESDRTDLERPFPFLETLDPYYYSENFLKELNVPKVIYKCVGKYSKEEFSDWLNEVKDKEVFSTFVGAASRKQKIALTVDESYELRKKINDNIIIGGVTIPERHTKKGNEHVRVFDKVKNGCSFFISQAVYNIEYAKDFLSDYYYYSLQNELEMVPIIITLTPCGSLKTLQFMEWLGINIPRWLKNELKYSGDILSKSMDISKHIYKELIQFSSEKNIPIGFNVESVAIRKEEIDASVDLLNGIYKEYN